MDQTEKGPAAQAVLVGHVEGITTRAESWPAGMITKIRESAAEKGSLVQREANFEYCQLRRPHSSLMMRVENKTLEEPVFQLTFRPIEALVLRASSISA